MKKSFHISLILFFTFACDPGRKSQPDPERQPSEAEIEEELRAPHPSSQNEMEIGPMSLKAEAAVEEFKKQIRTVLDNSECDVTNNRSACEFVSISNKSKEFTLDQQRFKTLIIDTSGMSIHSFVGLNGRVRGYYEFTDNTDLVEPELIYKNTSAHIKLFRDVVGKQRDFLPTKVLQKAMSEYNEKIHGLNEETFELEYRTGHGFVVSLILAEYSPLSSFVYLGANFTQQIKSEICTQDLNALRQTQRKIANGIIKLVQLNQITHINESAGLDFNNLSSIWKNSGCEGSIPREFALKMLQINLEEYLIPLSNLQDVVYVQAATNATLTAKQIKGEFINDCDNSKTPNRIRIAYFNEHRRNVPRTGMSLEKAQALGFELSSTPACVDLFVGSGRMNTKLGGDREVRDTAFNLYIRNEWPRVKALSNDYQFTSWAAPLATAYIQYLEASTDLGTLSPSDRIKQLTGHGKLKVHDPLRNKQLSYFEFL